jgi:alpha-1,3-rhamnosyl/mannosyltransferase
VQEAVRRAAKIIVDSDFVKKEVAITFGISLGRIASIALGVDARFRPRDAEETYRVLHRFGLTYQRYVLVVATLEPRKNIAAAIDAFERLPSAVRRRFRMVIAGGKGWGSDALEERLRTLASRGTICFLGYCPDADLPALYSGAAVFLYPSLYEGFGLPPLEAMASGVPVLVSDRSALPEVVGDAGQAFDPEDVPQLTEKLLGFLETPEDRFAFGVLGFRRSARFTWQCCAQQTADAYREVLS